MYSEEKRVAYSQIAPNHKASPAAVLNYFQDIAIDHSSFVGCSIKELDRESLAWLVVSTRFKARRYPEYREEIRVVTWPKSFYKIFGERGYEVLDKNGEPIIEGSSLWVLFNKEKGGAEMVSDEMKSRYTISDKEILPVIRRDIKMPPNLELVKEFAVEKRDLDSNNHVNNVKYVEYAAEILPDNEEIEQFEIFYRHGARLGDNLILSTAEAEGYIYGKITNQKDEVCVTMRLKTRAEQY